MSAVAAGAPGAPASAIVTREVEWRDTDAAGHYHHSTVIRWVEAAETLLHDRLGLADLMAFVPRVRYEVDYLGRLYYRDRVEVTLRVVAVGDTSARYAFEVDRLPERTAAARGEMVVVHLDRGTGAKASWPEHARTALLTRGCVTAGGVTGACTAHR